MSECMPSPRPPKPHEFPAIYELLDSVFRSRGGSMLFEFPRLLGEMNRANIRVVEIDGRIVAHAAIEIRDASLGGIPVRVAMLGSVATAEDHRGGGLAGSCVRSCFERALEAGCDYAIISGGRSLYTRMGARAVGDDTEIRITASQAATFARSDIEVKPWVEENLQEAVELYEEEAVRFIRPLEDWQAVMRSGFVSCSRACFLGAWELGRLAAYVVLHEPVDGVCRMVEYAGARGVFLGALKSAMEYMGADAFRIHLGHHDRVLSRRLSAQGVEGEPAPASGTVLVLDFASLMNKVRSRFLERSGEVAARQLSFSEEGPPLGPDNLFRIASGPDVVRIEGRGALAEFLFAVAGCSGEHCATDNANVRLWGAKTPFSAALPLPSLTYGLNYT